MNPSEAAYQESLSTLRFAKQVNSASMTNSAKRKQQQQRPSLQSRRPSKQGDLSSPPRNRVDSFDEFSGSSPSLLSPIGAKRRSGSFKILAQGSFDEDGTGGDLSQRNNSASAVQTGSAVPSLGQRRRGSSFSLQTSQKDELDEGKSPDASGTPGTGSVRRRPSVSSLRQTEMPAAPRTPKKPFNV